MDTSNLIETNHNILLNTVSNQANASGFSELILKNNLNKSTGLKNLVKAFFFPQNSQGCEFQENLTKNYELGAKTDCLKYFFLILTAFLFVYFCQKVIKTFIKVCRLNQIGDKIEINMHLLDAIRVPLVLAILIKTIMIMIFIDQKPYRFFCEFNSQMPINLYMITIVDSFMLAISLFTLISFIFLHSGAKSSITGSLISFIVSTAVFLIVFYNENLSFSSASNLPAFNFVFSLTYLVFLWIYSIFLKKYLKIK